MTQVVLLILDGWGYSQQSDFNAIAQARTPHWDQLIANKSLSLLSTSGQSVGLPDGQMGNSEVGHIHIGSGRVINQKLSIINESMTTGNPALSRFVSDSNGLTTHMIGLLSKGGVHSHLNHFYSMLDQFKTHTAQHEFICHLFSDGRDVMPGSFVQDITDFDDYLTTNRLGKIGTLSGRFYGMDRDSNWDRTNQATHAILDATGSRVESITQALDCVREMGDEFCRPMVIGDYQGVCDSSRCLLMNFRPDRIKQLQHQLSQKSAFNQIYTLSKLPHGSATHLIDIPAQSETLGKILSVNGLSQIRIAETEKFPHVSYFFNGGQDVCYPKERRTLIQSNKCHCHSEIPEMKARDITNHVIHAIDKKTDHFVVANLANADMVGHSGHWEPTVQSIETIDGCLADIVAAVERAGSHLIITADHGNAEQMRDHSGLKQHTAHTLNPVPLVYVGPNNISLAPTGDLTNIAATILELFGLPAEKNLSASLIRH